MGVTAWEFPGTIVGNRTRAGSNFNWANPTNAGADDGNFALADGTGASQVSAGLAASNFDFSAIPAGAVVNGIEIRVGDFKERNGNAFWNWLRLILPDDTDGSVSRQASLASIDTAEQTSEVGGQDDVWSEAGFSRADVLDVDFGFVIACTLTTDTTECDVDFMQMRIHWTLLPTATINTDDGNYGDNPPRVSSTGEVYTITRVGASDIGAYKSDDPFGAGFTEQDAAGRPSATPITCINNAQEGDLIHVICHNTGGIIYHLFNMATDNWDETETVVLSSPADTPFRSFGDMVINSAGELIVSYQGETERVHGGDKERVYAAYRDGSPPSWTTGVGLDAGGDIHYMNPVCVNSPEPTDNVHIHWLRETDTADPPVSNVDARARTLRANKTLDVVFSSSRDTNEAVLGFMNGVGFRNDSVSPGTKPLVWMGVNRDPSESFLETFTGVESTVDNDLGTIGGGSTDTDVPPHAETFFDHGILTTAITPALDGRASSDVYVLFSGGGTLGVDQDLYWAVSTDEVSTWSVPLELIDAVTIDFLSGTIYERNNLIVFGFQYEDASNNKYAEMVIKRLWRNAALLTPPPKVGARLYG